jgi:hypothetical protein
METIERIKNWKTTALGVIVLVLAVWRYVCNSIDTGAFISLMLLAYTFILAKNSLLEGITLGYYKLREATRPIERPADGPTDEAGG